VGLRRIGEFRVFALADYLLLLMKRRGIPESRYLHSGAPVIEIFGIDKSHPL